MTAEPLALLPLVAAPGFGREAEALAVARGFTYAGESDNLGDTSAPLVLWIDDSGLSIRQTGRRPMGPVFCDFVAGESRHRRLYGGGKSQAIARAVGVKDKPRLRVVDLTAGMGGDGFALASLGCNVTFVERHPVVAALLADGLQRARAAAADDSGLAEVIDHVTLVERDARQWLEECPAAERPDVLYLDPMFPERRKSAQVNKSMQIFHQMVGADEDAGNLLPLALQTARYRVVVKRPSHAPWLGNEKPTYALEGKSVRFDVYALRRLVGGA